MLIPSEKLIAAIDRVTGIDPAHVDRGKLLDAHRLILAKSRERIEADSSWPAMAEMLADKAVTVAHDIIARLVAGETTKVEAIASLSTLLDLTMGPVEPAVLKPINDALRMLKS